MKKYSDATISDFIQHYFDFIDNEQWYEVFGDALDAGIPNTDLIEFFSNAGIEVDLNKVYKASFMSIPQLYRNAYGRIYDWNTTTLPNNWIMIELHRFTPKQRVPRADIYLKFNTKTHDWTIESDIDPFTANNLSRPAYLDNLIGNGWSSFVKELSHYSILCETILQLIEI